MIYPSLDELIDKVDSRYTLVVQVAKRARQLVDGQDPMVSVDSDKPVTVAIHEVRAGKVHYSKTKEGIK
ncbi:MAG: DNA-directed RNA polymerase subunit omega [Clostridiales bacterium]|jgi:DNA-directed RNA polymerase subunit omega|nr:DNA-directed RNA polymerase subunit omega [Clostridiales bacterium]